MKCVLCGNQQAQRPELSFHIFPNETVLRGQWMQSLQLPAAAVEKTSYICSEHFKSKDFIRLGGKSYLRLEAVPMLEKQPTEVVQTVRRLKRLRRRNFNKRLVNVVLGTSNPMPSINRCKTVPQHGSYLHTKNKVSKVDAVTQVYNDAFNVGSVSIPVQGDSQLHPTSIKLTSTFNSGMQMGDASKSTEKVENFQVRLPTLSHNAIMTMDRSETEPRWPRDYICSTPIAYIQAVKIGRNGRVGLMKFTSTISRGTQTLIKDLPLPIPQELLNAVSDTTDLGRFVPINVVFPNEEVVTQEELKYLQDQVDKLKKIHNNKIRDVRRVRQQTVRKLARIRTLKETLIDLKTPPGEPRPPVVTDSDDSLVSEEDDMMIPDEEIQLPDSTTENHSSVANQNTATVTIPNNSTVANNSVSSSTAPNNSTPFKVNSVTVQASWKNITQSAQAKSDSRPATTPNAFMIAAPQPDVRSKIAAMLSKRAVSATLTVPSAKGFEALTVPHANITTNFNSKNMSVISDSNSVHIVMNPSVVQLQNNSGQDHAYQVQL